MVNLLTPQQVGDILHLKPRSVMALDIPRVRVGRTKRKVLFREEDVDQYVRSRLEYLEKGGKDHGRRIQKEQRKVGLQVLPSRAQLQAIRLGHQDGGKKGGAGPH